MCERNGYGIYLDILTEKNFSSTEVANINLIYWSLGSSSKRKGLEGLYSYFSQLRVLLEYINIWCNIQVLLYRLLKYSDLLFIKKCFSFHYLVYFRNRRRYFERSWKLFWRICWKFWGYQFTCQAINNITSGVHRDLPGAGGPCQLPQALFHDVGFYNQG